MKKIGKIEKNIPLPYIRSGGIFSGRLSTKMVCGAHPTYCRKQLQSTSIQHALHINAGSDRLPAEFLRNLCYVFALEAGDGQLIFGRPARAIGAGEGRRPVGRATGYFFHVEQPLLSVGNTDDNHAVMQ